MIKRSLGGLQIRRKVEKFHTRYMRWITVGQSRNNLHEQGNLSMVDKAKLLRQASIQCKVRKIGTRTAA